jgi:hypothetical protein
MSQPSEEKLQECALNTDRELWSRETQEEPFLPWAKIFMTGGDEGLGICFRGHCIVKPLEEWHALALASLEAEKRVEVPGQPPEQVDARLERFIGARSMAWALEEEGQQRLSTFPAYIDEFSLTVTDRISTDEVSEARRGFATETKTGEPKPPEQVEGLERPKGLELERLRLILEHECWDETDLEFVKQFTEGPHYPMLFKLIDHATALEAKLREAEAKLLKVQNTFHAQLDHSSAQGRAMSQSFLDLLSKLTASESRAERLEKALDKVERINCDAGMCFSEAIEKICIEALAKKEA